VEEVKDDVRARIPVLRREQMLAAARNALAREAELTRQAPAPRTIAVFPFVYAGTDGSLAPLSRALADMLTTDLSQTDRLSVLERAQVQALLDEMQLAESGLVDEATAARAGHLLAAGTVVQGRVDMPEEGAVRLEALAVPVAAAVTDVAPTVAQDALSRLFDAEKALVLGLFDDMGIELTEAERVAVNRRPTESLQALLAYGRGLQAMDAGNFEAAATAFETAAALDPSFATAIDRAESATRAAEAEGTSTGAIGDQAQEELPQPETGGGEFDDAVAEIVPGGGTPGGGDERDETAEIVGNEGIGSTSPTTIDVTLPRPNP
ncbi:MAG TPA: CsgG/HfaB family protein, partial [Longimicrobiales bacterium]